MRSLRSCLHLAGVVLATNACNIYESPSHLCRLEGGSYEEGCGAGECHYPQSLPGSTGGGSPVVPRPEPEAGVPRKPTNDATPSTGCDSNLDLDSIEGLDAAKAIGLCKVADPNGSDWGVLDARLVRPDGTPLGDPTSTGLLPSFGVQAPQEGKLMLALSSGVARAPGQPDHDANGSHDKGYGHGMPPGFPTSSPICPGVVPSTVARDGVTFELTVRVPAADHSVAFAHQLFTREYPSFVCSPYVDGFAAMMNGGSGEENIVFGAEHAPLGVLSPSFLQSCEPAFHNSVAFECLLGPSGLIDTGFEGHASTGWLKTTVPVVPASEITLRFSIWDGGDASLDSTVLIDDVSFSPATVLAATTVPK